MIEEFQEAKIEETSLFSKNENFLIKIMENLSLENSDRFSKYILSICGFCSSPDNAIRGAAGLVLCSSLKNDINSNKELILEKIGELLEDKSELVKVKIIKGLYLIQKKSE